MDLNQQVFKAPSIPKLGKRTVSSSVLRGAVKPQVKLKTTKFSFIKPVSKTEDSEKISKVDVERNVSVELSLKETNKILTDIQKQLSLDFAYRISEEKKALSAEKKRISAEKVSEKEAKIEKGGKNIVGKTFEKVTAPFKSIFQKLIDFFSIILTGILYNTAFEWLKDENNKKKLKEFFDFIGEYWQELLIIFAAYKLAKLVGVVFGIGLKLKKLVSWFKNRFGPKVKPPTTTPKPTPILSNAKLGRMNESYSRFIAGKSNILDRLKLLRRGMISPGQLFTKGSFEALQGTVKNVPKPSASSLGRGLTRGFAGVALEMGGSALIKSALSPLAEKTLKDSIDRINGYDQQKRQQTLERINQDLQKEKNYQSSPLHSLDKLVAMTGGTGLTQSEQKANFLLSVLKGLGETPKFSQGGTVGQGDRPGVDTTPAFMRSGQKILLDQGEEVIRSSQANLYRPLLKDINDNGAKLWEAFSRGVTDQSFLVREQYGFNRIFGDTTKEFTDFLEKEIKESKKRNRRPGTTPPPIIPPPPSPPAAPSAAAPAAAPPASSSGMNLPGTIHPQTNAILDNLFGRTPGTTDQMQQRMQLDPGGTPAPSETPAASPTPISPSSSPLVSSNIPSDDVLAKMNADQLKKFLRTDVSGASNRAVFDAAAKAREENQALRGTRKFDEEVLRASVRALRDSLQPVTPDRNLTRVKSGEGQGGFVQLPANVTQIPKAPQPSGGVNPNSANDTPPPTAVNWTGIERIIMEYYTGEIREEPLW